MISPSKIVIIKLQLIFNLCLLLCLLSTLFTDLFCNFFGHLKEKSQRVEKKLLSIIHRETGVLMEKWINETFSLFSSQVREDEKRCGTRAGLVSRPCFSRVPNERN